MPSKRSCHAAHSTGISEEELPMHGLWACGAGHCCADVTI
eukprot:COSAG04_NODE_1522_length_6466_cov_5.303720_5_plen_40_part_00